MHGGLEVAGGGLFKADAMMERKGTLIWVASHRAIAQPPACFSASALCDRRNPSIRCLLP